MKVDMKLRLIGPIAIVLSFAVLFGVVAYINLAPEEDGTPEPTARVGQLWTYEATERILSLDTSVDWGLLVDGRTLYGTPPDWSVDKTYFVTVVIADGTVLDFTIEVVP